MHSTKTRHVTSMLSLAFVVMATSCNPVEPLRGSCTDCNVVLISVDTLRADHLGAYGYARQTSPFIDSIADAGVVFEKAFTPRGLTRPSMVSLLTSLYPAASGVRSMTAKLNATIPTIADRLKAHGYATVSFRSGVLARFRDLGFGKVVGGEDAQITDLAGEWLSQNPQQKFFLWLHYFAPHDDYRPPAEFDRFTDPDYQGTYDGTREQLMDIAVRQLDLDESDYAHIVGLYDGEIAFVDSLIQRVFDAMKNANLLERTVVIIVGDHGEDLYEHNRYFQHMYSTYDSSLRIPLLLRLPDRMSVPTSRVDSVVEIIDIAPTLFELIDAPIPNEFAGISLLPLVDGTISDTQDHALSELWTDDGPGEILSIRTDRWRYIDNPKGKLPKGLPGHRFYEIASAELYDVQQDPGETSNVVERHPDVAAALRERLRKSYAQQLGAESEAGVDPKTVEQLRSLGYVP